MLGLNTNLLKEMASSATNTIASPGLLGTGIAGLASAGVWSLIKDARENKSEVEQLNKINFSVPAELQKLIRKNRTMIDKFDNAFHKATLTLLSGILEMSRLSMETFRDFSHYDEARPKEDKGFFGNIGSSLEKWNNFLNPAAQVLQWVGGLTPDAIRKMYGYDDKKDKEKQDKEQSRISGIFNSGYIGANFIKLDAGKHIIDRSPNHISASLNLSSATLGSINFSNRILISIMKSLGTQEVLGANEDVREENAWLGKLSRLPAQIMSLPGIDALKNITKSGWNILTAPLKIASKIVWFFDDVKFKFKDTWFGGLFSKTKEEILEKAGVNIKKDFWNAKEGGGPNVLEGIRHWTRLNSILLEKSVVLLSTIANKSIDMSDVEKYKEAGPRIYDWISGKYTDNKDFLKEHMEEAITKVYGQSLKGKITNTLGVLGDIIKGRDATESWDRQKKRGKREWGRTQDLTSEADIDKDLTTPDYRIPGMGAEEMAHIRGKGRFQSGKDAYSKIRAGLTVASGSAVMYAGLAKGFALGGLPGFAVALGGILYQTYKGGKAEDTFRQGQKDILAEDIKKMGGGELNYLNDNFKTTTKLSGSGKNIENNRLLMISENLHNISSFFVNPYPLFELGEKTSKKLDNIVIAIKDSNDLIFDMGKFFVSNYIWNPIIKFGDTLFGKLDQVISSINTSSELILDIGMDYIWKTFNTSSDKLDPVISSITVNNKPSVLDKIYSYLSTPYPHFELGTTSSDKLDQVISSINANKPSVLDKIYSYLSTPYPHFELGTTSSDKLDQVISSINANKPSVLDKIYSYLSTPYPHFELGTTSSDKLDQVISSINANKPSVLDKIYSYLKTPYPHFELGTTSSDKLDQVISSINANKPSVLDKIYSYLKTPYPHFELGTTSSDKLDQVISSINANNPSVLDKIYSYLKTPYPHFELGTTSSDKLDQVISSINANNPSVLDKIYSYLKTPYPHFELGTTSSDKLDQVISSINESNRLLSKDPTSNKPAGAIAAIQKNNQLLSRISPNILSRMEQLLIKLYNDDGNELKLVSKKIGKKVSREVIRSIKDKVTGTYGLFNGGMIPYLNQGGPIPGQPNGKTGKASDNATVIDDLTKRPIAKVGKGEYVFPKKVVEGLLKFAEKEVGPLAKIKEQKEDRRWYHLTEPLREIKTLLFGKFNMYFRDAWEQAKFNKKTKKELKDPFGGLLAGLLGTLAGGLTGTGLLKKLGLLGLFPFKVIGSVYKASLKLLGQDVMRAGRFLKDGIFKPLFKTTKNFIIKKKDKLILTLKEALEKQSSRFFTFLKNTPIGKFSTKLLSGFKENIVGKIVTLAKEAGESFLTNSKLGRFFASVFNKSLGAIKGVAAKIIPKLFSGAGGGNVIGRLLSKLPKLIGGIFKRLPGLNILFGAFDAVQGYKNAADITGVQNPSFLHKIGAGMAGIVSGLTFGLVSPKTIYGYGKEALDTITKSVSGIGDWFMNTTPIKAIKEFLGYTDKDPNPEQSFISRMWEKVKEVSTDAFNWLCDVPYIGPPFRLLRDAYTFLFGSESEEDPQPSLIARLWEKASGIAGDVVGFLKTQPFIGPVVSTMSDIYEFLFGEKDKAEIVEKNAFMQMVDDIKALNIDSFLTRLLGPLYTSAKGLYDKLFGEGSSKSLIDTSTNMLKSAKDHISKGLDKVANSSIGKAAGELYNDAKDLGSKAVNKVADSSVGKAAAGLYNDVKQTTSKVVEGASNLWSSLKNTVTGGDKKIIKVGKYSMRSDVYDAIIKASNKYGIPTSYMFSMAAQESGFDPNAKASTSSATGLYQFIKKTWTSMWGSPVPDVTDPYASADAAARYALKSKNELGRSDPAALYLGHFLGQGGASKLFKAIDKDPSMLASQVMSADQIKANKSVIKPNATVMDIYNWAKKKMGGAVDNLGGEENIILASKTSTLPNTTMISEESNKVANKNTVNQEPEEKFQRSSILPNTPVFKDNLNQQYTSVNYDQLEKQHFKETRDQSSISPVGQVQNLAQQIEDSKTPTVKEETPQERVAQTSTPESPPVPIINVNNVTPPQKDPYAGTYAKSIDPYYLDGFLSNLFPSMFTTFTNNVSKTFLFGDSLNLNPQTV